MNSLEKNIIVDCSSNEVRVGITENGHLVELYVEREENRKIIGNIYKGRVTNVLPGMQSAFVNIGTEKDVFLYIGDIDGFRPEESEDMPPEESAPKTINELLQMGQNIEIQILKEPIGTKGARGTTYMTLPGRYLVLMPGIDHVGVSRRIEEGERERLRAIGHAIQPPDMGLILRTVAEGRQAGELAADLDFLLKLWQKIKEREQHVAAPALIYRDLDLIQRMARDLFTADVSRFVINRPKKYTELLEFVESFSFSSSFAARVELYEGFVPIFEKYGLEADIARALRRKVWLKSGGYIVIERTEALSTIDVNTGKFVGRVNLEETVFKNNMEAVPEIVRQIRLRNIGGIIIIDFIDMRDSDHREQVVEYLKSEIERDKSKSNLLPINEFGLLEITRKRVGKGLDQICKSPCIYCRGEGRVLSPEYIADKVRRQLLKVAENTLSRFMSVTVHPDVAAVIRGVDDEKLFLLEDRLRKRVQVIADTTRHIEDVDIGT